MLLQALRAPFYRSYRKRLKVLLQIPEEASDQRVQNLIESGFSASCFKKFCKLTKITPKERHLIISAATLKIRTAAGQHLASDESHRLFGVAHIYATALAIFGDEEKATRWLSKQKNSLSGKTPMELAFAPQGVQQVEEMLIQLAEGLAL
ncbi:hypothetical protein D3C76_681140 [compost metagenome]